jgi:hypothetical protein
VSPCNFPVAEVWGWPETSQVRVQLRSLAAALGFATALGSMACSLHLEQTNTVAPRRARYNNAFFKRHNAQYRTSAAIHIAHAQQHDVLVFGKRGRAQSEDSAYASSWTRTVLEPPRFEPHMMDYAQHTGQAMWRLYQAIDWTHAHHEQTYDILADDRIPWPDKARVTREAVDYYLEHLKGVARSPAPLEVTMRRAAVMMKPYFGLYRTHYPLSAMFFYAAHWWHPVIYEAMMVGGNDAEQDVAVAQTQNVYLAQVLRDPPTRMLLSREVMPRYSRMSPESANIFDNLHMLHGIAYAILSYEGWSIGEKRAEMYRVLDAMSEKPGDRQLAARFALPAPEMEPRRYEPWMTDYEGPMNRIMEEMMGEMWPMMSADGSKQVPEAVMDQLRKKLRPGKEHGEHPGSLHEALMATAPGMKMTPEAKDAMKPGKSNPKMVEMMLRGWRDKAAALPAVEPYPMSTDPVLPAWEAPTEGKR